MAPIAAIDVKTLLPARSYSSCCRPQPCPPMAETTAELLDLCGCRVFSSIREVALVMTRLSSANLDKGSEVSISSLWTDSDERSHLIVGCNGDLMTHPTKRKKKR
uniref:Uncharacterized protein n=1 Tax=Oryza sativa subsp. japonica TaxID=39947 RepID=Q33AI3_ORYSJ|nr:hypothetical protein LOC_Os10g10000 [Oryza sativa Japonica Group]